MLERKKNLTIYDIAKLSGFSPKTVSRVINGERVKKSTYDKINEVIEESGYLPNMYARNLSKKNNINILVSVKKTESFPLRWFELLLDKIIIICKKYKMNVLVEYFDEDDEFNDSILAGSHSLVDGVILFYPSPIDRRIKFMKKHQIPFVVFSKYTSEEVVYVNNTDYDAMYNLAEILINRKLFKILMLMGGKSEVNIDRVRGVESCYSDNNLDKSFLTSIYGLKSMEEVYDYTINNIDKQNLPDCIFVSGDEKVLSLFKGLSIKKIKVPDDVSVVGFDNLPTSEFTIPSLSSISPNYNKLAQSLVTRLYRMLKEETLETSIEIGTEFIERDSLMK